MAEAKKGRGCFFYGCISLIVLAILTVVGIYFGARFFIKYARDNFTSTKPAVIAPTTLPPADGARVVQRVDDFKKSLREGKAAGPLELTSEELDYVVRNSSQNELKDHLGLSITNDRIRAQLSVPLDMYGPPWFGRFLNGEADVAVALSNNVVRFQLQNPTVNGKPVPGQLLTKINQGMEWRTDAGTNDMFNNIDRIEVKDGKIVFVPKGK